MIALHGGRLLLERYELTSNWQCRIRLGPNKAQQMRQDLETMSLRLAVIKAQSVYHEFCTGKPDDDKRKCWECIHWLPIANNCDLGFPEACHTSGRFARRCELFHFHSDPVRGD